MFKGQEVGPLAEASAGSRGSGAELPPPASNAYDSVYGKVIGRSVGLVDVDTGACQSGATIAVVLGLEVSSAQNTLRTGFIYPHVRAEIEFGIGTVNFKAYADWINGTVLSVPAENINVSAQYIKQTNPTEPDTTTEYPTYRVSAGLAYAGAGHNSNPARLTELVQIETQGGFQQFEIPAFAISWTLVSPVDTTVNVVGQGDEYDLEYEIAGPPTNAGQHDVENSFPIPNGTRFIQVFNSGAEPLTAFLIFGLAL